jgi:proteasome lid subunit RPN8/RPN11
MSGVAEASVRKAYVLDRFQVKLVSGFGGPSGPVEYYIAKKADTPYKVEGIEKDILVKHLNGITPDLLGKAAAIFKRVYSEHHSEMIVMLEWDEQSKKVILNRPRYSCISGARVTYKQERPNIGTIHSHSGFGAFFSNEDDKFEEVQPGIYMVMGMLHLDKPTYVASVTGNGERHHISVDEIMAKVDFSTKIEDSEYAWWMERVKLHSYVFNKSDGWCLLDWNGQVLWWSDNKEEIDSVSEQGISVVSCADLEAKKAEIEAKRREESSNKFGFRNWIGYGKFNSYTGRLDDDDQFEEIRPGVYGSKYFRNWVSDSLPKPSKPEFRGQKKSGKKAIKNTIESVLRHVKNTDTWDELVEALFETIDGLPEGRKKEVLDSIDAGSTMADPSFTEEGEKMLNAYMGHVDEQDVPNSLGTSDASRTEEKEPVQEVDTIDLRDDLDKIIDRNSIKKDWELHRYGD